MSLIDDARRVRENAHAPYSGFKVGAALRTAAGGVFSGCNVENVAYPEGTCAEAGAIAAMVAAGEAGIVEILVMADGEVPITPCGGCRQKIAEFGAPDTVIILANTQEELGRTTLAELLPGSFTPAHLGGVR
ncbi:MAG: cytidine deaminase [Rhodobacteraceae bacterium]|nr:cytidine deaminase [Paracoccaceae bacterium]